MPKKLRLATVEPKLSVGQENLFLVTNQGNLHPIGVVPGTDEMTLILGEDARGRLLEIGQVAGGDYPSPIVHAMLARPHLIRNLQGRSR